MSHSFPIASACSIGPEISKGVYRQTHGSILKTTSQTQILNPRPFLSLQGPRRLDANLRELTPNPAISVWREDQRHFQRTRVIASQYLSPVHGDEEARDKSYWTKREVKVWEERSREGSIHQETWIWTL